MQTEPREHDRNVRQAAVSRAVSGFFKLYCLIHHFSDLRFHRLLRAILAL